jgi:hypothetical protein
VGVIPILVPGRWRMARRVTARRVTFPAERAGAWDTVYKLTAATDGVLHAGFRRQFDEMWRQARHLWKEGAGR